MAYTYRLAFAAEAAGMVFLATVYGDDGAALATQPAGTFRDLGQGAYLWKTDAMPDGQGGIVKISEGASLIGIGIISPPETELLSYTAWASGHNRWTFDIASGRVRIYKADGITGDRSGVVTRDAATQQVTSFTPDPTFVPA